MGLRRSTPLTIQPAGATDAVDGSNVAQGLMAKLVNLVPSQNTRGLFQPRPAAEQMTAFPGFNTPGFVSALLVVGNIAYGMISTARNAGKDEPFSYNLLTNTFNTVSGVLNANTPTSPATSGAWTPPTMRVVGTRILVTHPGFPGGAVKFGWFDISGLSSTGITGDTHTNTTLDNLSSNVHNAGWRVGMAVAGTNVQAGTTIVSINTAGTAVVLSQATTGTTVGVALTVTGGTTAAPQWAAGDTNLNPLPSVPVGVLQMNGRAYYLCGKSIPFSDSLNATQITLATDVLQPANGLECTSGGPLGLLTQVTGGIVQSLIVFQGVSGIQQITGDKATSNLAINSNPLTTGTLAPLSITPTPFGLAFVSPHGLRIMTLEGTVTDPIGDAGSGIAQPFINSVVPSRIAAGSGADVYRATTQNGSTELQTQEDWWWDLTRKIWTGPHTFPASLLSPWMDTYVITPVSIVGKLFRSDAQPGLASTYTENAVPLTWNYTTVMLPDTEQMAMNAIVESTIAVALPYQQQIGIVATNENGQVLDQTAIDSDETAVANWGTAVWGVALWNAGLASFKQRLIAWTTPLVFKQMQVQITGNSVAGFQIGNLRLRYQILGYLLQENVT